jgi:hypothetical protein
MLLDDALVDFDKSGHRFAKIRLAPKSFGNQSATLWRVTAQLHFDLLNRGWRGIGRNGKIRSPKGVKVFRLHHLAAACSPEHDHGASAGQRLDRGNA